MNRSPSVIIKYGAGASASKAGGEAAPIQLLPAAAEAWRLHAMKIHLQARVTVSELAGKQDYKRVRRRHAPARFRSLARSRCRSVMCKPEAARRTPPCLVCRERMFGAVALRARRLGVSGLDLGGVMRGESGSRTPRAIMGATTAGLPAGLAPVRLPLPVTPWTRLRPRRLTPKKARALSARLTFL